MTVTVLGTGLMGAGMARSLLRAGLEVRVWNRSAEQARPLGDDGAAVAADVDTAVSGAHVVVTMLFDTDSVADVMARALPAAQEKDDDRRELRCGVPPRRRGQGHRAHRGGNACGWARIHG